MGDGDGTIETVGAGDGATVTVAAPPALTVAAGNGNPACCPATETFAVAVTPEVAVEEFEGAGAGEAVVPCSPLDMLVGVGDERDTDSANAAPKRAMPACTVGMLAANCAAPTAVSNR